jgi:bifunctional NMN adenylyltransferase/nudix hydrolase
MTFKYKVGVYIGRFQPIHLGHLETIEVMAKTCEKIIISIGSSNRPKTIENPWTQHERELMIRASVSDYLPKFDSERIRFQHVNDYMYNDNKWAAETYSSALMNGATQSKDTCLFGFFKDDSSYYLTMYPQWDLHRVVNYRNLNATDIREDMFINKSLSAESLDKMTPSTIKSVNAYIAQELERKDNLFDEYNYRLGYKSAWKTAPYAPTFTTVDALVVKSGHVLLVQRGRNPGKGLFALPGGFLNPGEYIKNGIIRELKEETRLKVSKEELEMRRDANPITVFDHPKRSKRGRTITHVGLIDLGNGQLPEIKADDDAAEVHWVPLSLVHKMSDKMFEDHFDIIVSLTSKF